MTEPGMAERAQIACIVDSYRLNRFMSSPRWTDAQVDAADDILEGLESQLANHLNAPITPIPWSETATVLRSGQLCTTYPVAEVNSINNVAVAAGVLPSGWNKQGHWLYATSSPVNALGMPFTVGTQAYPQPGLLARVEGIGTATVTYQAGWGNVPALRLAILKKARVLMATFNDDTINVHDLNATNPTSMVALPDQEWTDAELKSLERFRNIVAIR